MIKELRSHEVRHKCSPNIFSFNSTEELAPLDEGIIGQQRAVKATSFGLNIKSPEYNIYISGIPGTGRKSYTILSVKKIAKDTPTPDDWFYVYNFKQPNLPIALNLPAGMGRVFREDVKGLVKELSIELPKAFDSKDFEERKSRIVKALQEGANRLWEELYARAKELGFTVKRTSTGFVNIPLVEGREMTQEEYNKLPEEARKELEEKSRQLDEETMKIIKKIQELEREARGKIEELQKQVCLFAIGRLFEEIYTKYRNYKKAAEYLEMMKNDVLGHFEEFLPHEEAKNPLTAFVKSNFMQRYEVNLIVDNADTDGAPVVVEHNPTYYNLVGKVEYEQRMGVLSTDFTKIKGGSILKANGGYLILNITDVLKNIGSWDTLKRVLKSGHLKIENMGEHLGLTPVSSLAPQPIPIKLKIILIGTPLIHHLLCMYDEDFRELFKIKVDFDTDMERNDENVERLSRFIGEYCKKNSLKPLDRSGVARVVEYASELSSHQKKLSTRFNNIVSILQEADTWATIEGKDVITAELVSKAIKEKVYRSNMYEQKFQEFFKEGQLLIQTDGKETGQINGLSVLQLGEYSFGKPSRITATVHPGQKGIINIERETKMSGKIHSKGVMILSSYIASKYAQDIPLSLSASLCFEQLYEEVEGDSASSTELYALISALSGTPLRQDIAVTGSVDQKGNIQPIGGVNEKIAGFFDFCKIRGLTGKQGVIIPQQNVINLMLREDITEAIESGKFHIYAIDNIDEGIEILTGERAGKPDENGNFPEGSVHYRVKERLEGFSKVLTEWSKKEKEGA
ncbi:MAG: AAA family ATPase [Synergistetes bacterium]|nr:AAA family ATPase [Synergistota bacterium]